MKYRIGIDVGGTFTDFLLVDETGGAEIYKVLSTPADPSVAVFDGLQKIAETKSFPYKDFLGQIQIVVYGTTATTNAVLTGTGAITGFITTNGFRDVLNMRRGLKERQFDSHYAPPPPMVPRYLIRTVEERVDCYGREVTPLNIDDCLAAIQKLKDEQVEAIGVSFMYSFLNPLHEQEMGKLLKEHFPEAYISLSSEILPQVRFYERNSTTAMNAYVGIPLKRDIESLMARLAADNFKGTLLVMQSNGGVMSPEVAMRFAANTLLSGPAAGPLAGLATGRAHNLENLITVDMGGTSFDACLIRSGKANLTTEGQVGGHKVCFPMLDIHSIGAGGGSIAWLDSGGILRVGPHSAGAIPGPACYGLGGEQPTVTDADLLLGYLDVNYFHGGRKVLNTEAAEKAIYEKIAKPLGLNLIEAAYGIYRLINNNMATGLGVVSVGKGYDPREFSLIVAGGAGPVHASMIAKELDIPLIIIPKIAAVFCAAGMLTADLIHNYVRSYTCLLDKIDLDRLNILFGQMRMEAIESLRAEGVPSDRISLTCSVDLRYEGQFNEVEIPILVDTNGVIRNNDIKSLLQNFHQRHGELYGYSLPASLAEFINLRLSARGTTDKPAFTETPFMGREPAEAFKYERQAYFDGGFLKVPVYDGAKLGHGNIVCGPAIIDESATTILATPDYNLYIDQFNNYVLYRKEYSLEELLSNLRG
ncbi:MAG: hydantoinase/oxoprolinase family protein [Firmicutes bacterium]|nr:hydantoinase/oxoprolinase family protein [Bacillota bacterium]